MKVENISELEQDDVGKRVLGVPRLAVLGIFTASNRGSLLTMKQPPGGPEQKVERHCEMISAAERGLKEATASRPDFQFSA